MAFNWPPLIAGILALAPAAVILFITYGRYDGYFRDNVVFLFFMGGFLLGFPLFLLGLSLLVLAPLWYMVGQSLVEQLAKTAVLNRRKWQGKPHSVFNGGALGLGIAVISGLGFTYRLFQDPALFTPVTVGSAFLLLVGLAGLQFATGAFLGSGVSDGTPWRATALATLAYIPFAFLTVLWWGLANTPEGGAASYLWAVLAAAYGLLGVEYTRRRILPLGLTMDARRRMRREARSGA